MTGALVTGVPVVAAAVLLAAAGAVERAVLGAAQAHVLRRALPALRVRQWVTATAAAAAFAWAIGLLPMLTDGRFLELPVGVLIPIAVVLGTLLRASIGTAQWLVLRHLVHRSGWWILLTGVAWTAGLLIFTSVTTPLWRPGQSLPVIAAIGVLGGLLMAGTVAAVTGWGMVRLTHRELAPSRVAPIASCPHRELPPIASWPRHELPPISR